MFGLAWLGSAIVSIVTNIGKSPIDVIAAKVSEAFIQSKNAETEQLRIEADLRYKRYQAQHEAMIAGMAQSHEILMAEQKRWYTAIIRPLFAAPFILYIWKIVVYDVVLGLGATDRLSASIEQIMMVVIAAYFGIEAVSRLIRRK